MEKTTNSVLKLKFVLLVGILIGSSFFLIIELVPIDTDTIQLSSPRKKGTMPLSSAIHQVRYFHNLNDSLVEINDISQLLWALQGITHGPQFRTVPSAGATYPLEIFVLQTKSTSLKEGCYNYIPQDNSLKSIALSYNFTILLSALLGDDREAVSNVSTILFILADYSRTTDIYGNRGIQYVHLEVGHAIQNFLLQSTSLNLSTRVITNFTSQKIQEFFNTNLDPLVILPVGQSSDDNSVMLRMDVNNEANTEEISVEEAILRRKSVRDYQTGTISLSVVQDLLQDSTQILNISGNKSQIEFYIVAGVIENLTQGLYHYLLENHSLNQLVQGELRSSLKRAALNQQWVESAQLDVIICLNETWVSKESDPSFFKRLMMYQIGMLAQNIYLKCAALHLGTVVVGAFDETEVTEVLDTPSSLTPIYIMPVGLTAAYFEEPTGILPPLTEMARNVGLLLYIFFYFSLYLSLPTLRRHLKKKMRWIHCISGITPLIGVVFHFMIIHGFVSNLWDFINILSYLNAFYYFLIGILTLPMTRYDLGMLLARLALSLGILATVVGILFAFKLVKQRKTLKQIHKYAIFLTICCAITHNLLNGVIFASEPVLFLLLNILALDLYFLLYIYPDIVKVAFRQESFPQ
ncbi:MAG: SagB/ThcOx family dehydrogenase [Candidatus Hermodarchaeota archaeon]